MNNEYNPRSLADNGLNTVIDMGLMILGTKGAECWVQEKNAKLTSMGIAYQQTKRDVFNDALKKDLTLKHRFIVKYYCCCNRSIIVYKSIGV